MLALAAALSYGAADFCGGLASRRTSSIAVVVWSQAIGLVVLLAAFSFVHGVPRGGDLALGALCGVGGAFAVALLYRALAIGVMGVISPLTAVLAAAIPVLWAIEHGERPEPLAVLGIAFALVAVVLVSLAAPPADEDAPLARAPRRHPFPPGVLSAIAAGIAFGFFFVILAQTHRDAGLYPLLGTRVVSLSLLSLGALALRRPLRVARPGLRTIAFAGALDMSANVLYVLASHRGALSIVAVLTSLYPAGTVALA
ncbi:MAG TPA: DMT family transporter, partial [Candidatus Limnocylindria bacterium]|nr:DMT family transporter [Candidatus Limnocylindria bacterium]